MSVLLDLCIEFLGDIADLLIEKFTGKKKKGSQKKATHDHSRL